MSISDLNKVDGVGRGQNGELVLLITDHLDWKNEKKHLKALQNKINKYIGYIESKQFLEVYPNDNFEYFVLEIHFMYQITGRCKEFLSKVSEIIKQDNISICIEIA